MMTAHSSISRITAIIPVLNEESALPRTLKLLLAQGFDCLVVDGGSRDRTVQLARGLGTPVLSSPPGRARQMNLGARETRADILFFVHADSHPPPTAPRIIRHTLKRPGVAAGAFRLRIHPGTPLTSIIAALANFRSHFSQLPYGDQGLFLYRSTFFRIGGFPDIPLMEDLALVRRLKKTGRIAVSSRPMSTSDRRWRETGWLTNTLKNQYRLLRYHRGAPPEKLASAYPDVR